MRLTMKARQKVSKATANERPIAQEDLGSGVIVREDTKSPNMPTRFPGKRTTSKNIVADFPEERDDSFPTQALP